MNDILIRFRLFSFLAVVVLMILPSGCSDKSQPDQDAVPEDAVSGDAETPKETKRVDKKKKKKEKFLFKVDKFSRQTPVIVVDGRPITKGQYDDWLDVRCRMALFLDEKKMTAENLASTKHNLRSRAPAELIRNELIQHYAQTNGIVPSAQRLKAAEKELMQKYGKKLKTVDQVAKRLGGACTNMLSQIVFLDALDNECMARNATNDLTHVTDAEVDAQMARIKKWNEIAAQKVKESYEKAKKAKDEILAGAFFEDVAKKYAEVSPADGRDWDTVELGEFQADEPIAKWLVTAKPGDVSDPIEYDDVIAIFGLKSMYDGEAPEGYTPMKQYELVRCAFHAYEKIEEPGDREELRKAMIEERRSVVFRALGSTLLDAAKIEFPKGDDIFSEPRPVLPKEPAKAKKKKAGKNPKKILKGNL